MRSRQVLEDTLLLMFGSACVMLGLTFIVVHLYLDGWLSPAMFIELTNIPPVSSPKFNPELPSLGVITITACAMAVGIMAWWLGSAGGDTNVS